jgi:hypothetical protein
VIGMLHWRPEARVRSPRIRMRTAWLQLLQFVASGLSEPVFPPGKRYAVIRESVIPDGISAARYPLGRPGRIDPKAERA